MPGIIAPHGGYRDLHSFRNAEIVHDATVAFRRRFIGRQDRTHDQMARQIGNLAWKEHRSCATYRTSIENAPPEVTGNTMICLINQTNYLLDRLRRQPERRFTERLCRGRTQAKRNENRGIVVPDFETPV